MVHGNGQDLEHLAVTQDVPHLPCPEECSQCCALPLWWSFNLRASRSQFQCVVRARDSAPTVRSCGPLVTRQSTYKQSITTCEFSDEEYKKSAGGYLPWCGAAHLFPRKNHKDSKFDAAEAYRVSKMVNAAYYSLNVTEGRTAQTCLDSGMLKMPPNVTAKVLGQISIFVRETHVGVLVATVSVMGAKPDVMVLIPGTAGEMDQKPHKYSQLVAQFSSFLLEDYAPMPNISQGNEPKPAGIAYFYEVFKALRPHALRFLLKAKDTTGRLVVGGHSMGAAVASMMAAHLATELHLTSKPTLYTFGEPRTGDFWFAQAVDRLTTSWRVTSRGDPIIHLPPCQTASIASGCDQSSSSARLHHGVEIFYPDGTEEENFWECQAREDSSCSNGVGLLTQMRHGKHDHSHYFGTTKPDKCRGLDDLDSKKSGSCRWLGLTWMLHGGLLFAAFAACRVLP